MMANSTKQEEDQTRCAMLATLVTGGEVEGLDAEGVLVVGLAEAMEATAAALREIAIKRGDWRRGAASLTADASVKLRLVTEVLQKGK